MNAIKLILKQTFILLLVGSSFCFAVTKEQIKEAEEFFNREVVQYIINEGRRQANIELINENGENGRLEIKVTDKHDLGTHHFRFVESRNDEFPKRGQADIHFLADGMRHTSSAAFSVEKILELKALLALGGPDTPEKLKARQTLKRYRSIVRGSFRSNIYLHPLNSAGAPRGQTTPSYAQQDVLKQAQEFEAFRNEKGLKIGIVQPTGTGKTVVVFLHSEFLSNQPWAEGKEPLIIFNVENTLILDQTVASAARILGFQDQRGVAVRMYGNPRKGQSQPDPMTDITGRTRIVAISRSGHEALLNKGFHAYLQSLGRPLVLIVDEGHHSGNEEGDYKKTLEDFNAHMQRKDTVMIASATFFHSKGMVADKVDKHLAVMGLTEQEKFEIAQNERVAANTARAFFNTIDEGYLLPLSLALETKSGDVLYTTIFDQIRKSIRGTGTRIPEQYSETLDEMAQKIHSSIRNNVARRSMMLFKTQREAEEYSKELNKRLKVLAEAENTTSEVRFLHSGMNADQKQAVLDWFKNRSDTTLARHRYICAVDLFNEGADLPETNHLVIAKSMNTHEDGGFRLFQQVVGRGVRPGLGADKLHITDFTGSAAILLNVNNIGTHSRGPRRPRGERSNDGVMGMAADDDDDYGNEDEDEDEGSGGMEVTFNGQAVGNNASAVIREIYGEDVSAVDLPGGVDFDFNLFLLEGLEELRNEASRRGLLGQAEPTYQLFRQLANRLSQTSEKDKAEHRRFMRRLDSSKKDLDLSSDGTVGLKLNQILATYFRILNTPMTDFEKESRLLVLRKRAKSIFDTAYALIESYNANLWEAQSHLRIDIPSIHTKWGMRRVLRTLDPRAALGPVWAPATIRSFRDQQSVEFLSALYGAETPLRTVMEQWLLRIPAERRAEVSTFLGHIQWPAGALETATIDSLNHTSSLGNKGDELVIRFGQFLFVYATAIKEHDLHFRLTAPVSEITQEEMHAHIGKINEWELGSLSNSRPLWQAFASGEFVVPGVLPIQQPAAAVEPLVVPAPPAATAPPVTAAPVESTPPPSAVPPAVPTPMETPTFSRFVDSLGPFTTIPALNYLRDIALREAHISNTDFDFHGGVKNLFEFFASKIPNAIRRNQFIENVLNVAEIADDAGALARENLSSPSALQIKDLYQMLMDAVLAGRPHGENSGPSGPVGPDNGVPADLVIARPLTANQVHALLRSTSIVDEDQVMPTVYTELIATGVVKAIRKLGLKFGIYIESVDGLKTFFTFAAGKLAEPRSIDPLVRAEEVLSGVALIKEFENGSYFNWRRDDGAVLVFPNLGTPGFLAAQANLNNGISVLAEWLANNRNISLLGADNNAGKMTVKTIDRLEELLNETCEGQLLSGAAVENASSAARGNR